MAAVQLSVELFGWSFTVTLCPQEGEGEQASRGLEAVMDVCEEEVPNFGPPMDDIEYEEEEDRPWGLAFGFH